MSSIVLCAQELAEFYALATFYDLAHQYYAQQGITVGFSTLGKTARFCLGQDYPVVSGCANSIEVGCYCDVGTSGDISVDISLFKNFQKPLRDTDKELLRKRHSVSVNAPVVTIGHANYQPGLDELLSHLANHAQVYVLGQVASCVQKDHDNIQYISQYGVLRDYYALADVSIDASTLLPNVNPLHNFVEATLGGPVCMLQPYNINQYGYLELVQAQAISVSSTVDVLGQKVIELLSDSQRRAHIMHSRACHIRSARLEYFPVICSLIDKQLGLGDLLPSNLELLLNGDRYILKHPASDWSIPYPLSDLHHVHLLYSS